MQTLARHSHAGRQRVKKRKRFNKIDGQFSARTIEMMESPSFRLLSLSARRIRARPNNFLTVSTHRRGDLLTDSRG